MKRLPRRFGCLSFMALTLLASCKTASGEDTSEAAAGKSHRAVGHPTFLSPHASPISEHRGQVFVVNTAADTLDVIDVESRRIIRRVSVGIDPVSVAIRPDGLEIWVSNHISDSVSVIDNDSASDTYMCILATVQDIDTESRATTFDEPVGIAFANNNKAYVALSSENQIAVVDVPTRQIVKRLAIPAQDPRDLVVQGDRLYVLPFESNNQTQLSGGRPPFDGKLVTFDAYEHSVRNNNVLSLGAVLDIVKHPDVPDRDLFIFDTDTDELVSTVDSLGTLLYGIAADSAGNIYIAQTDARNDANGRSGTNKDGLAQLENRAFLNRITKVEFSAGDQAEVSFLDLEPVPPNQPEPDETFATPFAIAVLEDSKILVATAASSDKLVTIDPQSGRVIGQVQVGAVPRGIALSRAEDGSHTHGWVFNAVANTVSLVDLTDPTTPSVLETISMDDPTPDSIKRGRMAFNTAKASTTRTYSCASCHPDGHTDQLLWVLKTPIVTGGDQIMPRSTMPVRGLRDTAPFHWDGIPGDPYGGNNSANVHGSDPPNSSEDDPVSSTRHLVDGGLAGTMAMVGSEGVNDEGKAGALSAAERDDMAAFLLDVHYPPAPRRAYTNEVSQDAKEGFRLFHLDGDLQGQPKPNVCGDCHRMPFLVSTNTPGTGMDAPTWRGAYDRWLILPQGRLNIIEFDFFAEIAKQGIPERQMWQFSWAGRTRFNPVWDMVLEGSTGFSGAYARQVTLNRSTATDSLTKNLLAAMETSASEGGIVLDVDGALLGGDGVYPLKLQYSTDEKGGEYFNPENADQVFTTSELISLAANGGFVGTLSARHGVKADASHPQPALWTQGALAHQTGRQQFPILHPDDQQMTISGRHVRERAHLILDGRRVDGLISVDGKTLNIEFAALPSDGMHLMQVQNDEGLFSNDFIFFVAASDQDAVKLRRRLDRPHIDQSKALDDAVAVGNLDEIRSFVDDGFDVNARRRDTGGTPLSTAALHQRLEAARYLIAQGADVSGTNRDGNTPLHVAVFVGSGELTRSLLDQGASPTHKNRRGESPIDIASSEWTAETEDFYRQIGRATGIDFDLAALRDSRPEILAMLREHGDKNAEE